MGIPAVGEVVLVPFPFSDLSQTKVRPAVCLADAGRGDWILCQVTSKSYADPQAIVLDTHDFASGGLHALSYARPGKLFTANDQLLTGSIGTLTPTTFHGLITAIIRLLQPTAIP